MKSSFFSLIKDIALVYVVFIFLNLFQNLILVYPFYDLGFETCLMFKIEYLIYSIFYILILSLSHAKKLKLFSNALLIYPFLQIISREFIVFISLCKLNDMDDFCSIQVSIRFKYLLLVILLISLSKFVKNNRLSLVYLLILPVFPLTHMLLNAYRLQLEYLTSLLFRQIQVVLSNVKVL